MSAISNVGTSSSLLYLSTQAGGVDSIDDPAADSTSVAGTAANGPAAATITGGTATSPLADLRSQIESAVTGAVSQLPAGSSPRDILQAVRSAVEDTLKANGLDPSQIGGRHGGHHHHHAQGISADPTLAATGADPDGDGDSDQQAAADPLLAALDATAGNPTPAPSLLAAERQQLQGSKRCSRRRDRSLRHRIACGRCVSSLVQQLSGNTSTQSDSQNGKPAAQANSLLAALQGSSSGGLDLTGVFKALFQGFPNGTGLDVQA